MGNGPCPNAPPTGEQSGSSGAGFYNITVTQDPSDPNTKLKVSWAYEPDSWAHTGSAGSAVPTDCHYDWVIIYRDNVAVDTVPVVVIDNHPGAPTLYDTGAFFDTGLTPGTTYQYKLSAWVDYDDAGNNESALTGGYAGSTNIAPVANNSSEIVTKNGVLNANVSASDPDGGPNTFILRSTSGANYGTVSFTGAGSTGYTYTPSPGYVGADSFNYEIDDNAATASATVSIYVNNPPVATNTVHSTNEDTPLSGQAVATDSDSAPSPLAYAIVTQPTNGVATIDSATGVFNYTPNLNWNSADGRGQDVILFGVYDGHDSDLATLTITVNAVNDDPVITLTAGDPQRGQAGTDPLIVSYESPGSYYEPGATATDVEDGVLTPTISGVSPDVAYPGKYQYVIYTVTDSDSATDTKNREVRVRLEPTTVTGSASGNIITLVWNNMNFSPGSSDPGYNGSHTARYNLYVLDPSNNQTQLISHQNYMNYVHSVSVAGTYQFWVTIDDANGNYETSASSNVFSVNVTMPPPGPWYISVTDAVTSPWVEGKLVWTDVAAPDTDVHSFQVEQSDDGGNYFSVIATISVGLGNTPTAAQTEYVATGLTPSTQYQFRVYAYDPVGGFSAASNIAHYTTVATPNGMQTADVDEKGVSGVITVTGIFYNGWGWTTTDPGSETDITQWANVTMETSGAMWSVGNFPAGAHEIWTAAVGWVTAPLTHHIAFNTYDGIHPTPTVTLLQDNQTLSVAVPHSGIYDWTSVFYTIDYYSWTGAPGDSLANTSWIDSQEDANGDFTIDLGPTTSSAPAYPHGLHDLKVLGSYSENGVDEQAGVTPVNLPFTRWDGIQDISVPTILDDGTPDNVTLVPIGSSPDSPHGWRFSFDGPPLDSNGNQLTDLSNWGEFVIGEVTYTQPYTSHQATISRAGTYNVWVQACWADGTPLLRMGLPTDQQWLSYGPFTVPQHAYGGLTDVGVTSDRDTGEIIIRVTGDYHHWHYSIGQMFSGSAPNHVIAGEGTMVSTGDTARYTPTEPGKQIIYVAGVDLNHALISASAGQRPVFTRIVWHGDPTTLVDPDSPYDPTALLIQSGYFSSYVSESVADSRGSRTNPPVAITSAQLSAELGFATEATIDVFVPVYGLVPLLSFYVSRDFSGVAFDAMVTDQFVTIDNSIVASTITEGGLEAVAADLGKPAPLVEFRVDALHSEGTISFTEHQRILTGSTAPELFSTTGGGTNNDEPIFVTRTEQSYLEYELNPTRTTVATSATVVVALDADNEGVRADTIFNRTTEWLYTNNFYPAARNREDGTTKPYADVYRTHYQPDHSTRGWKGWVNTRRIVDFVPDDPYLEGGFVNNPDISSFVASEEDIEVSLLPEGDPGTIRYDQFSSLIIDYTFNPAVVLEEGDSDDWGAYLETGGWMGADLLTRVVLPPASQGASLQAVFDAEWFLDADYPDATGQQRPTRLDPVLFVASWFDPQITLNQYGYTYQDSVGLGPLKP